jgi:hypothetical protein
VAVERNAYRILEGRLRRNWKYTIKMDLSHLGGAMVSVLAIRPIFHEFKPGRGDGFLSAIKSAAHLPSEEK